MSWKKWPIPVWMRTQVLAQTRTIFLRVLVQWNPTLTSCSYNYTYHICNRQQYTQQIQSPQLRRQLRTSQVSGRCTFLPAETIIINKQGYHSVYHQNKWFLKEALHFVQYMLKFTEQCSKYYFILEKTSDSISSQWKHFSTDRTNKNSLWSTGMHA